jgi:DNA-binding response OmpR family regulator
MSAAPHILVVEDDAKIRSLLRTCFEGAGFRVSEAAAGGTALELIQSDSFDLVTLDLSLADGDGLTVGRAIRAQSQVPIIMLTGKGDMIDRVVGLELGADDYIAKPFHLREVLARVRAVLRRQSAAAAPSPAAAPAPHAEEIAFGDWILDITRRELRSRSGEVRELTTGEFDLLRVLAARPRRVLSRDQIMDLMRGQDYSGSRPIPPTRG